MRRLIATYSDHYIVCGYGRVGRQVALALRQRRRDVVVIEESDSGRQLADGDGMTWLQGNASDDEMLAQAGIATAAAVISCVDSDAENTFVTLSARQLRSDITIGSRSSREDLLPRTLQVGTGAPGAFPTIAEALETVVGEDCEILAETTALVAGRPVTLDLLLSWNSLRGDTTVGWTLGLVWMLNSLFTWVIAGD